MRFDRCYADLCLLLDVSRAFSQHVIIVVGGEKLSAESWCVDIWRRACDPVLGEIPILIGRRSGARMDHKRSEPFLTLFECGFVLYNLDCLISSWLSI